MALSSSGQPARPPQARLTFLLLLPTLAASVCTADMNRIEGIAQRDSQGKRPDGKCYSHVADYIDASGYGGIQKNGFDNAIPPAYWAYAHDFADYLNKDGNAARLHLNNTQAEYENNPYNAPAGAIVVVRAGTPGTANPRAGDITVKGYGSAFWNGGAMGYGGSSNFPPSNNYVLGIFEPLTCSGSGPSPGPSGSCKECADCVKGGGGHACLPKCSGCGAACTNCIKSGGGEACASRCTGSASVGDEATLQRPTSMSVRFV